MEVGKELRADIKEAIRKLDVRKQAKEEKARLEKVCDQNFPEHVGHGLKGEWGRVAAGLDSSFIERVEYFDAMFVSMKVRCGCGEILEITREMLDQA